MALHLFFRVGLMAAVVVAGLCPAARADAGKPADPAGSSATRIEAAWREQLLDQLSPSRRAGGGGGAKVSPQADAAGGCDGVKNGGFGFHTNQDDKPWWQVDLGSAAAIGRVVVFNRCTISERAARLCVLLSEDGKAWRTVYRHDGRIFKGVTDGKPLVVPLNGERARFVRVQEPERTWMHLDEIEVYAPADPEKNLALRRPANQSSASNWSTNNLPKGPAKPARKKAGKKTSSKASGPSGVAVPHAGYVTAVADVLRAGRMLAIDLAAAGVDTAPFGAEADRIAAALDTVAPGAAELTSYGLYFRARRAVRELALKNPALDFARLLLVRRGARNLGLPANWQSNSSLRPTGYDNDLALLTDFRRPDRLGEIRTLFRPDGGKFVGDVDLHFDGGRMLFSMPGKHNRWQVWEIRTDGTGLRELTLIDAPDVNNYDACYLPSRPASSGRGGQAGDGIVFTSTAPFIGVPCVRGNSHVTNLYLRRPDGTIRRLTFDQDHDWCPTVLPNGRVMYLRWEYSDLPHSNSRILFDMNPDGTGQMALYGSNSYWPNSLFYARPVPGHPSMIAGIVTGHHGVRRMGELVLFDPARGRQEADGAVQRIGDYGKRVEPIIRDRLVDASWPKFLHPFPLGANYHLAACKPTPRSAWGLYLVDVFDNRVLLAEQDGYALFEPIPLRPTPAPPVIADKVDTSRTDAVVFLTDVYRGEGLKGVPRGTVQKLRLFTYSFCYHGIGGLLGVVGADGPWDVKRVLGTVPVEADGSAMFRIPANVPIAIQPLDADGQALQIMRSWFVGMPGEVVSCVGCHERARETPPVAFGGALRREPAEIEPWRGPARGFSYAREVQPVIDRHCLACHDGQKKVSGTSSRNGPKGAAQKRFLTPFSDCAEKVPDTFFRPMPDLRGVAIDDWRIRHKGNGGRDSGNFSVGYDALSRYVRRPGIESNIRMLTPMEYHASTTELVQMLRAGHHGVTLDAEAWDRLITWIDLNCPFHGTWSEAVGAKRVGTQAARRQELLKRYAGVDVHEEAVPAAALGPVEPVAPGPVAAPPSPPAVQCPGWPFDADEARRRQAKLGQTARSIDLGEGVALELVHVPAGEFVLGSAGGASASPAGRVRIARPFWIGRVEVTNEQFARFDPLHDSRVESKHGYQFGIHGYPANQPRQPVVRVSWREATAFCRWLTRRGGTGLTFCLPTEAQWEYACRAGTDGPFSYGGADADFSAFANLADAKLTELAGDPYTDAVPMKSPNRFDDWVPKDARFNDGALISVEVGGYRPNAWGLHDAHGNVAEWTRSLYRPYPYRADDGRNDPAAAGPRVVRGGSWYDRPHRCRSAFRLAYRPYQPVFNVGFRVAATAQ